MRDHYIAKRMAKVEKTDNAKHWGGCGANGTRGCRRWSCKLLKIPLEYWLAASMRAEHMHSL